MRLLQGRTGVAILDLQILKLCRGELSENV